MSINLRAILLQIQSEQERQFDNELDLSVPDPNRGIIVRIHPDGKRYYAKKVTRLMKCVVLGRKCPELFDQYIESLDARAELDVVCATGLSALWIAVMNSNTVSTDRIVEKLIEKNANLYQQSKQGTSLLHCAVFAHCSMVSTCSLETIRILAQLSYGKDVLHKTSPTNGFTPLDEASYLSVFGHSEAVVQRLLSLLKSIGAQDRSNENNNALLTCIQAICLIEHRCKSTRKNRVAFSDQVYSIEDFDLSSAIRVAELLMQAGYRFPPGMFDHQWIRKYVVLSSNLMVKQHESLQYKESFSQLIKQNQTGLEAIIRDFI